MITNYFSHKRNMQMLLEVTVWISNKKYRYTQCAFILCLKRMTYHKNTLRIKIKISQKTAKKTNDTQTFCDVSNCSYNVKWCHTANTLETGPELHVEPWIIYDRWSVLDHLSFSRFFANCYNLFIAYQSRILALPWVAASHLWNEACLQH